MSDLTRITERCMEITQTTCLMAHPEAVELFEQLQTPLREIIEAVSPDAHLVADVKNASDHSWTLHFCLCDDWCHTHESINPGECIAGPKTREMLETKLSEFLLTPRNVLFKMRDGTFANDDLTQLRLKLNQIPNIVRKNLKIQNHFEFVACGPQVAAACLHISNFTLQVDASVADQVQKALEDNGFEIETKSLL
ncbi:MAG TPA: hypothetical protein VMG59_10490 [Phycisphaerae bacterium]|nr:hypothetical protein [Phycisphaerae bacterium]